MEDQNIIALYLNRDETAIQETQQKYGNYCGKIAHNVLSNQEDSEECLNDTWLKAWHTIPPQIPNLFRVYLGCLVRTIAINLYHHRRAQKRYPGMELLLSELDECIPAKQTVESSVEAGYLSTVISQWLMELEPRDRRLFLRRYWYGESVQTLAKEWGCTANAVSSRLKRLRKGLKQQLEKEGV